MRVISLLPFIFICVVVSNATFFPLNQQDMYIEQGFGDSNFFGSAIDININWAAVSTNRSSVYLYKLNTDGSLTYFTKLNHSDSDFGKAVALNGDTLFVSAPSTLSVYVYTYTQSKWDLFQVIKSIGFPYDQFGNALASQGNTLVIGAPTQNQTIGAMHIYTFADGSWNFKQQIHGTTVGGWLGWSISMDAGFLISGSVINTVYIFEINPVSGNWERTSVIMPPAASSKFGYSVSIHGNTIVVGDYAFNSLAGIAHVYVRNETWNYQSKLVGSGATSNDYFGITVSVWGDAILIGSGKTSGFPVSSVYIFVRSGAVWVEQAVLYDAQRQDMMFKNSPIVALIDRIALIGTPYANYQRIVNGSIVTTWGTGAIYSKTVLCQSPNLFDNCTKTCLCAHGICDAGYYGTGKCMMCDGTYSGIYCNETCNCNNGKCSPDPKDPPVCYACDDTHYGPTCDQACSCTNGACNNSISGDGKCISCPKDTFGPLCDKPCSCSGNGVCNSGPKGDGICSSCKQNYFGSNCDKVCSSLCASCDDGPDGTGNCILCDLDQAGPDCSITCPITCLSCDHGIHGTGKCLDCSKNRFGEDCQLCNCTAYGYCVSGVKGTGLCSACQSGYYSKDCSKRCNCNKGIKCDDGINGTGACLDPPPNAPQPQSIPNVPQPNTPEPFPDLTPIDDFPSSALEKQMKIMFTIITLFFFVFM